MAMAVLSFLSCNSSPHQEIPATRSPRGVKTGALSAPEWKFQVLNHARRRLTLQRLPPDCDCDRAEQDAGQQICPSASRQSGQLRQDDAENQPAKESTRMRGD